MQASGNNTIFRKFLCHAPDRLRRAHDGDGITSSQRASTI
jgi:hypothetical protein